MQEKWLVAGGGERKIQPASSLLRFSRESDMARPLFLCLILGVAGMLSGRHGVCTGARAQESSPLADATAIFPEAYWFGPMQSTTGPEPPPGVAPKRPKARPLAEGDVVIPGVPGYQWRHGCGPTVVGMVVGYYDANGFPDLISGDASTQTDAVNQAIASQGDSENPRHYEDYSLPMDSTQSKPLPDKSELPEGDEHASDSIADFMRTSWSAAANKYGWAWSSDIAPAWRDYVNHVAPYYKPGFTNYHPLNPITWDLLKEEVQAGRPMVFLVDTDGNGGTDHFVTVIGYRDSQGYQEYACLDTWYPPTQIRWEQFRPMASGNAWGIWGGTKFTLEVILTPTPSPTETPSPTPSATASPTPSPTESPTPTPSPSASPLPPTGHLWIM